MHKHTHTYTETNIHIEEEYRFLCMDVSVKLTDFFFYIQQQHSKALFDVTSLTV